MDFEWLIQNQQQHEERLPKVLMVGELHVAIAGQNVTAISLSDHVLLRIPNFRSALALRNRPIQGLDSIGKLLSIRQLRLKLQIGQRKVTDLFPQPGWFLRLLSPTVREIVRGSHR